MEIPMKKTILLLGFASILSVGTAYAATTTAPAAKPAATTVPAAPAVATAAKVPVACGDMSKQVDDALKGAKLSTAKMKIAAMHDKAGNNLCKVKKDAAADAEFSKVMKMLKKS
jgi:hypothetical protein